MTWQEGVAVALICAGLLAGGYIAAQRPTFWIEFGTRLFKASWPYVFKYITRQMPPDEMERFNHCLRSGGKWNYRTRKCE